MIKILIADDHAIVRAGLRKLLDPDRAVTVVGEATNGAECVEMLGRLKTFHKPVTEGLPTTRPEPGLADKSLFDAFP